MPGSLLAIGCDCFKGFRAQKIETVKQGWWTSMEVRLPGVIPYVGPTGDCRWRHLERSLCPDQVLKPTWPNPIRLGLPRLPAGNPQDVTHMNLLDPGLSKQVQSLEAQPQA